MIRPEWKKIETDFYYTLNETIKPLVEICQDYADDEMAKLKAEHLQDMVNSIKAVENGYREQLNDLGKAHAAEIAALTKPSPQLIVPNPYAGQMPVNSTATFADAWGEGFAAGIKAATVQEKPQAYKDLTDQEIANIGGESYEDQTRECYVLDQKFYRAIIAADRKLNGAKQREVKPEPVTVTVTGRFWKYDSGQVVFAHPKSYDSFVNGKWLTDEETRKFPNA